MLSAIESPAVRPTAGVDKIPASNSEGAALGVSSGEDCEVRIVTESNCTIWRAIRPVHKWGKFQPLLSDFGQKSQTQPYQKRSPNGLQEPRILMMPPLLTF